MAPQILNRVLQRTTSSQQHELDVKPALLHGYERRRVKEADYPGIIPSPSSSNSSNTSSVLGTLVSNLTSSDIVHLDRFEGPEYLKKPVKVRVLREPVSVGGRREVSVAKPGGEHLRDVLDAASVGEAGGKGEGQEGEEVDA
ncbi:AIG2-like family, partial [Aspergillus sclerotialis]